MNGYKFPIKKVRVACPCGVNCDYRPDDGGIWFVVPDARDAEKLEHSEVCSGELQLDEMLPEGRYPFLPDEFFSCGEYTKLPLAE